MNKKSSMEFYRLLPPNLQNNKTKAMAIVLDNQYRKILEFASILNIYCDISKADERVCDIIAKSFCINVYDITLPVEAKRSLVKAGLRAFYNAGTMTAINDVLKDIHGDLIAEEWYKYGGKPFMFKAVLDIKDIPLYGETYKAIRNAIETYKAARTHVEAIGIKHSDHFKNKNEARMESFQVFPSVSNFYANLPKLNGNYKMDGTVKMNAVCEKGLELHQFKISTSCSNTYGFGGTMYRNICMDGTYQMSGKVRMNGGYETL